MPLPILQSHLDPTPENLVRLFHRTQLHWARHLGEETQLESGVAITNRELIRVPGANGVVDAAVPPGSSVDEVLDEVRRHFAAAETTCRRWVLNPAAPEERTRPLSARLLAGGWQARPRDVMHLGAAAARHRADAPGLTIIPARASFRHARALAEEAADERGERRLADASMLHLDDPHWDVSIALRDGRAVAGVGVLAVGDLGRVDQLFVSPQFRGQGVGRTMMRRALEVCARSLFKHVLLRVPPEAAPAIHLFTVMGFTRVGQMTAFQQADND